MNPAHQTHEMIWSGCAVTEGRRMATKNTKKHAADEILHRAYKRAGASRRAEGNFVLFVAIPV
ncbi:hypothetical protein OpiT1DRAFT_01169 [Opitutaceae bacterium TAV1]|nr:hypothetical protein OPIT5_20645 [Opitutaceae bacterium TAV5]EIP96741.1 hypothetical protein OpiT1DRAFT_01164 [Opitutaceae bacterium TAV1]EIP96746.1 hypothetical protein OpiT1DRAFT_01169 [Opitutaceae bacterium TAV1]